MPGVCEVTCGKPRFLLTHRSGALHDDYPQVLEAEALKLPPADRSRLLERLVASLDVDEELEAAWEAVADAREAEIDTGTLAAVSFEEAIARLEARSPG